VPVTEPVAQSFTTTLRFAIRGSVQDMKLSARNQLNGTVTGINHGEAIANVEVEVAGQRLVASITVEAVGELGIVVGSEVTVIVKASDVMLAVPD
jgi:molybdopterin-binding protein